VEYFQSCVTITFSGHCIYDSSLDTSARILAAFIFSFAKQKNMMISNKYIIIYLNLHTNILHLFSISKNTQIAIDYNVYSLFYYLIHKTCIFTNYNFITSCNFLYSCWALFFSIQSDVHNEF